jgi:hypothetical protein
VHYGCESFDRALTRLVRKYHDWVSFLPVEMFCKQAKRLAEAIVIAIMDFVENYPTDCRTGRVFVSRRVL